MFVCIWSNIDIYVNIYEIEERQTSLKWHIHDATVGVLRKDSRVGKKDEMGVYKI